MAAADGGAAKHNQSTDRRLRRENIRSNHYGIMRDRGKFQDQAAPKYNHLIEKATDP